MSKTKQTNKLNLERQLIYLLLHHRPVVSDFIAQGIPTDFFMEEHQPLIRSIVDVFSEHDVLLTRNTYLEKLKEWKVPKDRVRFEFAFNRAFAAVCSPDEFPLLIEKLYDEFLHERLGDALDRVSKDMKKGTKRNAIKNLIADCEQLLQGFRKQEGESFYGNISALSQENIQYIEDVRSGKRQPEPLLLTGIPEIDMTMMTGLERGTLTLLCADVGGYKSCLMLNIALNVWGQGHNVLFIPLEMHKDQMWRRACAREAKINSELLIANLKKLTDEQMDRIREMQKAWDASEAKFYIMQEPGRITVSQIQRQIERHVEIFRPRLVVIDYVANLEADRERYGRNDLEIGDMLKDMREMGKSWKFAVISAAQLGREALKRIRKAAATNEKTMIHSEDIRGSHEYSADADNIYAMMKNPNEPDSELFLYCVKARNGKTTFHNGETKGVLCVDAPQGRIWSPCQDSYGDFLADAPQKDGTADAVDMAIDDIVSQQESQEGHTPAKKGQFDSEAADEWDFLSQSSPSASVSNHATKEEIDEVLNEIDMGKVKSANIDDDDDLSF